MKKNTIPAAQMAELQALASLPDDQINTRDIPEQKDWIGAKRGVFFARSSTKHSYNATLVTK